MKYGIVKVAAVTPDIKVNDPKANAREITERIAELKTCGAEIVVFPELCVCGSTAGDLMFARELLDGCVAAAKDIAAATPDGMLVYFGMPLEANGRVYNCAVAASGGRILGANAKRGGDGRYFCPAPYYPVHCPALDCDIGNMIAVCGNHKHLAVAAEIGDDMWADVPPSVDACRAGATLICGLAASHEQTGRAELRKTIIVSSSFKQKCAYVYANAGNGESTTDLVYSGHNIIAQNGEVVAKSAPFGSGRAVADIDTDIIDSARRKQPLIGSAAPAFYVNFELGAALKLEKPPARYPFLPSGPSADESAELILTMQARALASRIGASGCKKAVLGVSGGLDSALALLVCVRALKRGDIYAVTMPAFGTTQKTKSNAVALCEALGVSVNTIDIKQTVSMHLKDIDHDKKDTVYENAQARYRTMTLFDIANKENGLVVGTGDLSELALGWCTYNGDHMANYGVNAGVPKTLVKYLVGYEAKRLGGNVSDVLNSILSTDISPELLPPDGSDIAQKTEDILGKYDLHDFIIYNYMRYGFTREKIEYLLRAAFPEVKQANVKSTLDTFYKRFFASQFKRSCSPDGVKVGDISFSPRGAFCMPSDAGDSK